jgi:ribosomal protein L29
MKYSDMTKLQKDELDKTMYEIKTELMKLNAQVAIGTTPKSTKQIRELKKALARFETLRMQELKKNMQALNVDKVEKKRNYKHH